MPDRRYSRTPDTVALLAGCAVSGAVLAATGTVPASVEDIVPWWVGLTWALMLAGSAIVSLVGLLHRDQVNAWFLEFFGRVILSGCAAVYCLALVTVASSLNSTVIVALSAAVAIGSAGRAWQVWRRLDQVKAALRRETKA